MTNCSWTVGVMTLLPAIYIQYGPRRVHAPGGDGKAPRVAVALRGACAPFRAEKARERGTPMDPRRSR